MKVNIGKNIWTCIMVMLAGIVGGVALLVMAFLIPVSEEQAKKSLDIIVAEDSYPALPIVGDFSGMNFQGFAPGVLDNSSDRIMLFTALDMAKADQGALVRSMRMYNGYMGKDYAYYWHGYVSILRPLLGIIAYDDLRFLNGLLQLLLMFGLTGMVWRKRGKVYGAVMLTSYVLLMPVALMFSLQYTWVFYIAMLSTLLLVRRARWAAENQRYIPVFLAIGMLTSYFDLLTYPLVTWGIPLLWWMMMREPAEKGSDRILETVLSGISWVLGYGLFWAVKWCLGTLVLRQDVFQMALDEIFTRSGVEEKLSLAERFGAAYINWKHYGYFIYAVILGAWLFWGLARYLRKGWAVQNNVFACLLAGASSMVWYLVLANHTLIHHIFTYRIHSVGILAFLAIWAGAFDGGGMEARSVRGSRPVKLLAILLIGACSVGGAFLARDGIWATNGYAAWHRVRLSGQDVLSVEFRPTFSRIRDFGICAETDRESGMIEITVLDGERKVCRETVSLESWGEEAYHSIPVEWKFTSGKEYIMQMRLLDSDEAVQVLVTDGEDSPLREFGVLRMNGETVEGQIVTGITYWHYPTSRKQQLFLVLSWMGMLSCLGLALYTVYDTAAGKYRMRRG